MSKFTFIKQAEDDNWIEEGDAKVTVEFNAIGLDHILEEFTYFLRGAGFFADGHLELVHDEELITTDDDLDNLDQFFGKTREIVKNLDQNSSYIPVYHRPIKSNPQTDDE